MYSLLKRAGLLALLGASVGCASSGNQVLETWNYDLSGNGHPDLVYRIKNPLISRMYQTDWCDHVITNMKNFNTRQSVFLGMCEADHQLIAKDLNGDGLTDLLYQEGEMKNGKLHVSSGTIFYQLPDGSFEFGSSTE